MLEVINFPWRINKYSDKRASRKNEEEEEEEENVMGEAKYGNVIIICDSLW